MGCSRLNHCCCGCSLQTGTKIIGFLGLFLLLLSIYLHVEASSGQDNDPIITYNINRNLGITFTIQGLASVALLICAFRNNNKFLLLPSLVINMLAIVSLAVTFVVLVIAVAMTSSTLVQENMQKAVDVAAVGEIGDISVPTKGLGQMLSGLLIAILVVNVIGLVLSIYFWIVIFSYYLELKERELDLANARNFVECGKL